MTSGHVRPGHLVLLASFGTGLSWGATLLRWQEERSPPSIRRIFDVNEVPFPASS